MKVNLSAHMRFILLIGLLISSLVPRAAEAASPRWTVSCAMSHMSANDPIVHYGEFDSSHMHTFFGNRTTNASSTTATLLKGDSSCENGLNTVDHSAYWVPTFYRGSTPVNPSINVYYTRLRGSGSSIAHPIPQGLRMIAGSAGATSPQSSSIVSWRCKDSKGTEVKIASSVPTCASGQSLGAKIIFPSCWDGKNLDSADHKSHMAYPDSATVKCPSTHPVQLPAVSYAVNYGTGNGPGSQYRLSSGSQYTMHGDYFDAWDTKTMSALINSCLNAGRDCSGIKRSEINLAAATTTTPAPITKPASKVMDTEMNMDMSKPVATHTSSDQKGQVLAATTLPATGAVATGALGLTALAASFYYWHTRRRSLRQALSKLKHN